jgi:hypothetical protein
MISTWGNTGYPQNIASLLTSRHPLELHHDNQTERSAQLMVFPANVVENMLIKQTHR